MIEGGLAGLSAAGALAERGLAVTLFEREPHLGGKCAGWQEEVDGERVDVDHGFHAFFHHYYNLNAFLGRVGLDAALRPIDDYLIQERDGKRWRFADVDPTPVLNLAALARAGLYRIRDIVLSRARDPMGVFLEYDEPATFALLDDVSYARFAREAELPRALRLVFNTFARAFFAAEDRLSMAELVKSFHFYYLSHDRGLLYRHLEGTYREAFIAPIARHLEAQGVELRVGVGVDALAPADEGLTVDGERFDYAVIATTSKGARALLEGSPELARAAPTLARQLRSTRASQRYAVLRAWLDRPLRDDVPVFVATERAAALDSVTALHRCQAAAADWARERGGAVVELHCYAVPDAMSPGEVAEALLGELRAHFPELASATVVRRHLQVRDDFTAFHVGMAAERPATTTEVPRLTLAGDWVKLPIPAMLMEAAFTSGLYAANAVLEREGLRRHAVDSVPLRGLLAPLGRRRLERQARRRARDAVDPRTTEAAPQR
ncbi:MAG: FAD-dependent oxidoreductase [Nannocystaceae bacterium]